MSEPQTHSSDDEVPLPPERLRYKVAGTDFAEWFTKSGKMSVQDLFRGLQSIGYSYDQFTDVLEWGCGCGRILRHLPKPQNTKRLYGNDIDAEALSWVDGNLPWVQTSRTNGLPPLPYPDGSFDLIFNHSVMTHLDEAYQNAWLTELYRVLRPGGVLTLTVSGRNAFQIFLDTFPTDSPARIEYSAKLRDNGIVYISQDQWTGDFPDFYHTTFHDTNYVFDHWSKYFDIRSYIPRGALEYQDLIVMQKPETAVSRTDTYQTYLNEHHPATTEELKHRIRVLEQPGRAPPEPQQRAAGPVTADPQVDLRLDALERNAAGVSAELTRLAAASQADRERHERTERELHDVYLSRSWLLTKPWRKMGRIVKAATQPEESPRGPKPPQG